MKRVLSSLCIIFLLAVTAQANIFSGQFGAATSSAPGVTTYCGATKAAAGTDTACSMTAADVTTRLAAPITSINVTGGTINGTAIGSTTPAAGTFTTMAGWKDEVIAPATGNITTAQMKGLIINNYGQTDDATLSLASFTKGLFFTVILGTNLPAPIAKYWRLDPNGSESIYLVSGGTATSCGAGKYVGIASAAAGATLSCVSFQTGASAYSLLCAPVSGTWACEP